MLRNALQLAAWVALGLIVFATLSPIGERPRLPMPVTFERAGAFCLVGLLLALAYPRNIWWIAVFLLVAIISLEWMQELRSDRHGRGLDAVVKIIGAVIGLVIGRAFGAWQSLALVRKRGT